MDQLLVQAYGCGYERLSSWAGLIDRINVFPVPDSDTGRNLKISLTPLREIKGNSEQTTNQLLLCATGNSGNIAAQFFSGLLEAETPEKLNMAVANGTAKAWQAVADPKHGTMLTVFDRLTKALSAHNKIDPTAVTEIIDHLRQSVMDTTDLLPDLKKARVVDAGALAMFIFFEGFLNRLASIQTDFVPITELFAGKLSISSSYDFRYDRNYCVDTLVEMNDPFTAKQIQAIQACGQSVVIVPQQSCVKIHLHTDDRNAVKDKIKSMGHILSWTDENISEQIEKARNKTVGQAMLVMTDAAGSVTREDSEKLGMALLDSYLVFEDKAVPETLFPPSSLYETMRKGKRVTTAQASTFERHQLYSSAMAQNDQIVYLCVGSVFTGNYDTAIQWKKENDPENRFRVIDTAAASGRLGVIALKVAEYANQTGDIDAVVGFAEKLVDKCQEFIFLDCLKYLVAGGRLSGTSGFFGDFLKLKPVISPTRCGAVKVGVVRSQKGQLKFALSKLSQNLKSDKACFIMLEYSDNRNWVEGIVMPEIKQQYPLADVILQPLSLTSGTHMGPGTWGVAFLPE